MADLDRLKIKVDVPPLSEWVEGVAEELRQEIRAIVRDEVMQMSRRHIPPFKG